MQSHSHTATHKYQNTSCLALAQSMWLLWMYNCIVQHITTCLKLDHMVLGPDIAINATMYKYEKFSREKNLLNKQQTDQPNLNLSTT